MGMRLESFRYTIKVYLLLIKKVLFLCLLLFLLILYNYFCVVSLLCGRFFFLYVMNFGDMSGEQISPNSVLCARDVCLVLYLGDIMSMHSSLLCSIRQLWLVFIIYVMFFFILEFDIHLMLYMLSLQFLDDLKVLYVLPFFITYISNKHYAAHLSALH